MLPDNFRISSYFLQCRRLRHQNFGGAEGQVLNKCVIESAPECGPLCSPQGMEIYTPSCRKCGKVKYT